MGLETTIKHRVEVLTKLNGYTSITISNITLNIKTPLVVSKQTFTIVSIPSPYNGTRGQPWLVKVGVVTSVEYQKIQFCIPNGGVREIKSNQGPPHDALCKF